MQIVHIIIAIRPSPVASASVASASVASAPAVFVAFPGFHHLVVVHGSPDFLAEDVEACYPVALVVYYLLLVVYCPLVLSLPKDAFPVFVPSVVAAVDYGVFYQLFLKSAN